MTSPSRVGSIARNASCAYPTASVRNGDLAAVVRAYKDCCRAKLRAQLASFRREPTLGSAVKRAGLATRPDDKRYDHQRRLTGTVLLDGSQRLRKAHLEGTADFDELHRLVEETIGAIRGIGPLTVYDTALRIGAKLGHKPQRVYLHSGTRQGARRLGLRWRLPYLPVADFPPELQELQPHEIEDCVCIFKDKLKVNQRSNSALQPTAAKVARGRGVSARR